MIAYHAQQAAEKLINAYLVACGMSSDARGFRTHEIDDLRDLVRRYDEDLAESLAIADELSEYAVEARYPAIAPGVDEAVTAEAAWRAVEVAEEVEASLRQLLRPILPAEPGGKREMNDEREEDASEAG